MLSEATSGSASHSTRSAGAPGRMVAGSVDPPRVDAASAVAASRACSGRQAGRPSRVRCTAAAIPAHGSNGETGASEPNRSVAPASARARSG